MTHIRYSHALLVAGLSVGAAPAFAQGTQALSFSKDVAPIIQRRCATCHVQGAQGGLKLDTLSNALKGGQKGQDIIPGNAVGSKLVGMIEGRLQPVMPPGPRRIPANEIETIRNWIQQGAKDGPVAPFGGLNTLPVRPGVPGRVVQATEGVSILEPKEGASVREKVIIKVPAHSVATNGFAGIYIDGKFQAAIAPASAEDLDDADKKKAAPADAPLEYVWNTKAPMHENDVTVATSERFVQDGPHLIQVKIYNNDSNLVGQAQVTVNVQNRVAATNPTQLVKLWYGGRVGETYSLQNHVKLTANAGQAGTAFGRPTAAIAPGPESLQHEETTRFEVSLEDLAPGSGQGLWLERRESPLTIVVNNLKQIVRFDSHLRYYDLKKTGEAVTPKVMEREGRIPILNPIDLPGHLHRMNENFLTNLRVNLGAYITGAIKAERLQANIEGVEWEANEPCVRIRVNYNAGNSKLDINSLGIQKADFQILSGTSTIWFSETSNRVLKAKHEINGTLIVDTSQLSQSGFGGAEGAAGGDLSPGGSSFPGAPMGSGFPGGSSYYQNAGRAASGSSGYSSRMGSAYPGGSASYGAPMGSAYPGGSGSASSYGMGSAYPGAGGAAPGGGTGIAPPTKKRYHAVFTVETTLAPEKEKATTVVAQQ